MSRAKSISTIETEIVKSEAELTKTEKKGDATAVKFLALQKQKQDYEAK